MPLKALAGYWAIFGQPATPELVVYDRGGDSTPTRQRLAFHYRTLPGTDFDIDT